MQHEQPGKWGKPVPSDERQGVGPHFNKDMIASNESRSEAPGRSAGDQHAGEVVNSTEDDAGEEPSPSEEGM